MPPYLVLARKYRPSTFSDVIGQGHVVQTLKNSITSGRVGHAFLFCGVRGVGKTTVARILAKSLNCTGRKPDDADPCNKCVSCREISGGYSVDVVEIDGASHTSVENIREINDNIKYPPVASLYKIIIIDEVHMISINAFNALLKTLEEPPAHAKFIFATTESHKVPATINSRCQRFNFRTISTADISSGLSRILEQENLQADSESIYVIAREARGSFRDALSLLDQVIAFSDGPITMGQVSSILGIDGRDGLATLVGMAIGRDSQGALRLLNELFQKGYDPDQFVIDLIQYLRNLIIVATITDGGVISSLVDVSQSELEEMSKIAAQSSSMELQNLFAIVLKAEAEIRKSLNPWVALEMMTLRLANASQLVDLRTLVEKLDKLERTHVVKQPEMGVSHVRPKSGLIDFSAETSREFKPADNESEITTALNRKVEETDKCAPSIATERIYPAPIGNPADVWIGLKTRIRGHGHESVLSLMEHAELVSYGPKMVEIGFTKAVYRDQFEASIKNKPELKSILDDFFGKVQVKTLMLSEETSLVNHKPYEAVLDGQTDQHRAIRSEAMENPVIRSALTEFENSSVEEIRILAPR
jgi:DNA polymerase-3 subunit gamma/tau